MMASTQTDKPVRGRPFQKGYDSRRHKFTRDECSKGFWAMVESVVDRHPDAINSNGAHMVVNALPAILKKKGGA